MNKIEKKQVLFLCTHNSCRSQIAEGLLRALRNEKYNAFSAGIIKTKVHPLAITVMDEIGIDISNQFSKTIQKYAGKEFDYVVTVCDNARENCPFFPGKKMIHKSFSDPSSKKGSEKEKLHAFRETRDEIKRWIQDQFH